MARRVRRSNVKGRNALLEALPAADRDSLLEKMERVASPIRETIYESNGPIRHAYFPLAGVYSLVVIMSDGQTVEAATVGNEGMVGMPLYFGAESSPHRALAQIEGEALRMRAKDFRAALEHEGPLHDVLRRYYQGLVNQMAYSVACNRLHSIEERMCRWLLMSHDRVAEDQFSLTQEFLAQMLGVRRPSVTVVAGVLQKAGMIAYARGRIVILDRERLEASACECYSIVRDEFDRLVGTPVG